MDAAVWGQIWLLLFWASRGLDLLQLVYLNVVTVLSSLSPLPTSCISHVRGSSTPDSSIYTLYYWHEMWHTSVSNLGETEIRPVQIFNLSAQLEQMT